mgnify:CR=1 FL=1
MKFVVHYSCGEGWVKGKPFWEQGLVPHREYLVNNLKKKLLAGGPFKDHTGGLVIIEADKVEEIEEVIENDPAIVERKLEAVIYPWIPVSGVFNL